MGLVMWIRVGMGLVPKAQTVRRVDALGEPHPNIIQTTSLPAPHFTPCAGR